MKRRNSLNEWRLRKIDCPVTGSNSSGGIVYGSLIDITPRLGYFIKRHLTDEFFRGNVSVYKAGSE
jgi:hypothetical protein